MLRLDLNWISVVGLALGLTAFALLGVEIWLDYQITVASLLGDGAPYANAHLWMVAAVVGVVVYLVGRIVWFVKNGYGMPTRR